LNEKPTGSASDNKDGQAASLSDPSHSSSTGRGELLPTPPTGLQSYVPPPPRKVWPAIAGASLLGLAVVAGVFGLSHRTRVKAVREVSSAQLGQAAVSETALPGALPQTNATSAVAASATEAPATTPDAAPAAPAVAAPAAVTAATEPNRQAATTGRRSNPKTAAARLSKTGKAQERKDCDPPYTIDPNGIRRVKHECL